MISVPAGAQIGVACGATDMRRGFDGLAMMVQEVLKRSPYCGHLFVFRGKRADRIKVLWWTALDTATSGLAATRVRQRYAAN